MEIYYWSDKGYRKVIMQGKFFRGVHIFVLQCTVFGRKSEHKTDVTVWHGIHFHKINLWNILVIGNYYVNFQNYQNLMLLTSSDTRRTLMHLFLFTNSAQRELVSVCTQSIHNRNWLSLPYIFASYEILSIDRMSWDSSILSILYFYN